MNIDENKLKRLKVLHLSYLTESDRNAAQATEDGFVLNGTLIEAIPDLLSKLKPDAVEYSSVESKGVTKTTLSDNSVVLEVPLVEETSKKKRVRKKKA